MREKICDLEIFQQILAKFIMHVFRSKSHWERLIFSFYENYTLYIIISYEGRSLLIKFFS